MVTELYPPNCSGGGWSTYNLAKALDDTEEVEVKVLAVNQEEVKEDVPIEQIDVTRFPNELAYYQIKKEIDKRKEEFDVIQGQHSLTIPPLGMIDDNPTVGVIRDYWPVCYRTTLRDRFGNNHLNCGAKCLASTVMDWHLFTPYKVSNHYLRKNLTVKVDKLCTKSNFVTERMQEHGLDQAETVRDFVQDGFGEDEGSKGEGHIVYFGKIIENKGPQVLIEVITDILESHPDQKFTFFGPDTSFQSELEERIKELGIEENVEFLGTLEFEDVKRRVKGAKMVVHPSQWHEPLSRVCIESLSLGTPVISTKTGGSPEIIRNGETGIIFEDKEKLAGAVVKLLDDEEHRKELASQGKKLVREKYSKEKAVKEWRRIYNSISKGD